IRTKRLRTIELGGRHFQLRAAMTSVASPSDIGHATLFHEPDERFPSPAPVVPCVFDAAPDARLRFSAERMSLARSHQRSTRYRISRRLTAPLFPDQFRLASRQQHREFRTRSTHASPSPAIVHRRASVSPSNKLWQSLAARHRLAHDNRLRNNSLVAE